MLNFVVFTVLVLLCEIKSLTADSGKFSILCSREAIDSQRTSIPYPGDKRKFILCTAEGEYYVFNCEQGQVFSEAERHCLDGSFSQTTPATVQCPTPFWIDITFESIPLGQNRVTDCEKNPSLVCEHWYRRFKVNPEMFIQCSRNGEAFLRKCLQGLKWNDRLKICAHGTLQPESCQVPSWLDPTETGLPLDISNPCPAVQKCSVYVRYPLNQQKFIECDENGAGWIKTCPSGMLWVEATNQCGYGLPTTKYPPVDGRIDCGPNPCRKSRTGVLTEREMFHNCAHSDKHFVMCDPWGDMFVKKCPHDLDWSEEVFACGPAHVIGK